MIACPHCKARSSWIVDKRNGDGYVRRRRQCDDCGERFTTREILVETKQVVPHDKVASLRRRLRAQKPSFHA